MSDSTIQTFSEGRKRALVRPDLDAHFSFDWFEPGFWADQATPVAHGGRGSAWFITSALGSWVLRHFSRGGLPGRVIRSRYLFLGHSKVRSVREYHLLEAMRAQGLPVPTPVAAFYERQGISYRAALIIEKLESSTPLMQFQQVGDAALWRQTGQCIRRFHDHGVFHADLNANNILVSESGTAEPQVYLIDFDRGYYHSDRSPSAPWKQANLARLERSLIKGTKEDLPETTRASLWESLMSGYNHTQGYNLPQ